MILNNLTLKIPKELGFANYSNKVSNNSPSLVGTNIPRMVKNINHLSNCRTPTNQTPPSIRITYI